VDNLILLIEKLMEKYGNIEKKLEDKASADMTKHLDKRMQQIEDRLTQIDRELASKFQSIESQLQVGTNASGKDNVISDEELIKHAVQEEITKITTEERDQENRKRNIIVYRIPQKKTEVVSERKQSDTLFVTDLLDAVFNTKIEDAEIDKIYRRGRWQEDKPIPLLLAFHDNEKKDHVMANLQNLKYSVDKFKKTGISHASPPREREENKRMVE